MEFGDKMVMHMGMRIRITWLTGGTVRGKRIMWLAGGTVREKG